MYFNLIHKKNCDNSLLLSDFCSYFRPEHWTDVFIVVPVICFGYQVEYILLFEKESMGVYSYALLHDGGFCVTVSPERCANILVYGEAHAAGVHEDAAGRHGNLLVCLHWHRVVWLFDVRW